MNVQIAGYIKRGAFDLLYNPKGNMTVTLNLHTTNGPGSSMHIAEDLTHAKDKPLNISRSNR